MTVCVSYQYQHNLINVDTTFCIGVLDTLTKCYDNLCMLTMSYRDCKSNLLEQGCTVHTSSLKRLIFRIGLLLLPWLRRKSTGYIQLNYVEGGQISHGRKFNTFILTTSSSSEQYNLCVLFQPISLFASLNYNSEGLDF